MRAEHFFQYLVARQKRGVARGICSVCSAHSGVLEAAFVQAERDGLPVLIESTVNQVNQFGGYTGMTPDGFAGYVVGIADAMRFPRERVMLGGDHLGPYPWRAEDAASAMAKSRGLVSASVLAGYEKIHLDASMPLGGDETDRHGGVAPRVVAEREAELAAAAEAAYCERLRAHPQASPPVYVIGTEVPRPGGIVAGGEGEGRASVTRPEDVRETVGLCEQAFRDRGLAAAWPRVRAVVAQPGVEFGDQEIIAYDRPRAAPLCAAARELPGIVLEGHSTDYQSTERLRQLVEDGVAILKVGPALTFALRECLFGLECIERELLQGRPAARPSALSEALERAMIAEPAHWRGYYAGEEPALRFSRRFSLSDRSRYYWTVPAVSAAVGALLSNVERTGIPLPLLSQYLPVQYAAVRDGRLRNEPVALLRESVCRVLEQYSTAVRGA